MASKEHISLSDFIKSVHSKLRDEAKILGVESAWENHLQQENSLRKYAENMKKLATEHWKDPSQTESKAISRIRWVYEACMTYFSEIDTFRMKEIDVLKKIDKDRKVDLNSLKKDFESLKLLDVGSCYNPFNEFTNFDVTAIDIAPACEDVLKCDFLSVCLGDQNTIKDNCILELKRASYHIAVFSLLLEYLPDANQRRKCCEKAYSLLKPEGILVVITPDSKHAGANAKIMKSWRFVLARMGFTRIKYEKLTYLHCMIFRKTIHREVSERWAQIHENSDIYHNIFIPQDFNSCRSDNKCEKPVGKRAEWIFMPFQDIIE